MNISSSEIIAVLRQFNPWWQGGKIPDLPSWNRAAYQDIKEWIEHPPSNRALLLTGARQTGKTTLFLQAIDSLVASGIHSRKILYATFDHPLLKLVGLDQLISVWREFATESEGTEYLFLDEIQTQKDWQVWVKHQVDFDKRRRIAITGSAMSVLTENQESGVGRWQTIRLPTLSFFEFLEIRKTIFHELPQITTLQSLFDWKPAMFEEIAFLGKELVGHFHEYLIRGGFPQTAMVEQIYTSQKLLREDIVDKVLKRDMTALFGVRRVMELEQTFLYLCLHDGGILDMGTLCDSLQVKRPTAMHFIDLLESAHLIHQLRPFGYGKEILRSRQKIYLADPAFAPSVLLRGRELLEDPIALGQAVETAFFKHLFTRYYHQSISFSFWKGKKNQEVDIIADTGKRPIPFEVKYRNQETTLRDVPGLLEFCDERDVKRGYVITKSLQDFGVTSTPTGTQILRIPAPFACYWLGQSELDWT
jgi:predicted AAA+ superfamily ATPase